MKRVTVAAAGVEGDACEQFLRELSDIHVRRVTDPASVRLADADLLWLHDVEGPVPGEVRSWLEAGGQLLLTLRAAALPPELGLETVPPDDRREMVWHHAEDEFWLDVYRSFHAFPHVRGLGAFGPHPLFAGLDQGAYVWAPREGEPYHWVTYRAEWPREGRVVAVERSFIHLNADRAVAWEYPVGAGGVLCLGAFIQLAALDPLLTRQLRAVLRNALAGNAIPARTRLGTVTLWPGREDAAPPPPSPAVPEVPGCSGPWSVALAPLAIRSEAEQDEPWTLAGRRVLLAGGERKGLGEVWFHPFRALCQARCEIGGQRVEPAWVDVAPDRVERVLLAGEFIAAERWSSALEAPVFVWEIESGDDGMPVTVQWLTDLRRMWPYPAGGYGPLRWRLGESGGEPDRTRLWIGATHGEVQLVVKVEGGEIEAGEAGEAEVAGAADGVHGVAVRVRGTGRLRVVVVGGVDRGDLERALALLARQGLRGIAAERSGHADRIRTHLVSVEAPAETIERGFEWAKVRLDSFVAEVPGVGRSLLAGYAESRPGWGHGRPGYAWFFGRDACWTAFAALALGDRDIARDVLRFLSRHQDVSGKILHEYTTSGLVHFDAADSTPLYLLLAGRYAAWTGDLEYLERYWTRLLRAYRFALETDRDGDGIIENHRVGHGWIEHGPLGGDHVTLYLAACWIAALESLVPVARVRGDTALADELAERAVTARASVRRRFRVNGEYALGLREDGSPRFHRTAMLAVPLLLGVVPPEEAVSWYDAIASDRFSAPWGVRMIARDDPLFDPVGYHLGAVWPLYTGWVSLAEWRGGRYGAALAHLEANAALGFARARGAFDEVLHGLEGTAAGVCPDQAWSAAMVVSPVVEGLWGIVPDALNGAVAIGPHLPPGWSDTALRRLRVGGTVLDLRLRRRGSAIALRLERISGSRIRVSCGLRTAERVVALTLNDEPLGGERAVFELDAGVEVGFQVGGEC